MKHSFPIDHMGRYFEIEHQLLSKSHSNSKIKSIHVLAEDVCHFCKRSEVT